MSDTPRPHVYVCAMASRSRIEEFVFDSCVRGYHKYQETWTPQDGEELECIREPTNSTDRYAVAVVLKGTDCIVGNLPRKLLKLCSCFFEKRKQYLLREGFHLLYPKGQAIK